MCVAAPGRVVEIAGNIAKVEYQGIKDKAHTGIIPVQVGDYVLVHAGLIIQVIAETEAQSLIELFAELEELEDA